MGCGKTVRIKEYKYIKVRRNYGHGKAEGEDRSEKVGWKKAEKKEKTDTFYCRSISDTHFAGSILCNE